MTDFSDLPPNLIFEKILFPCPTKVAVQLSFILSKTYWDQDVLSSYSAPVLDFDEYDDFFRHNLKDDFLRHNLKAVFRLYNHKEYDLHRHEQFARFLEGYLEYYREKGHQLLNKLRLVMSLKSSEDVAILSRWLELAYERGVKELEISRPTRIPKVFTLEEHPLSWMTTFANAKSLTSLKLDGVRLTPFENTWDGTDDFPLLLPCLKTLSLKCIRFGKNEDSLYKLLHTCSSIEHLSLILVHSDQFHLPTLSLKSLEFRQCNLFVNWETYPVLIDALESFTWVGFGCEGFFNLWEMVLSMAGKSLTFLKLECERLHNFPSANNHRSFPSLKTISFTEVQEVDLLPILSECPSLENLSLVECRFEKSTCYVRSSTLKSLEVKHCRRLELLQVHGAKNLESFTFFSQPFKNKSSCDSDSGIDSICAEVTLDNSINLKNNNICVTDLVKFSVNGLHYKSGGYLKLEDFFHRIAPCARNNIKINKEVFFD